MRQKADRWLSVEPIEVVFDDENNPDRKSVFEFPPQATPSGWAIYDSKSDVDSLPKCPLFPPNLLGSLAVSKKPVKIEAVNALYAQYFKPGGFYVPASCKPSQKGENNALETCGTTYPWTILKK